MGAGMRMVLYGITLDPGLRRGDELYWEAL